MIMHGANLDMLSKRSLEHYGGFSFSELEGKIDGWAREAGLNARFFQTNHEGDLIEELHRVPELADAVILNAGSWTHYSWAI